MRSCSNWYVVTGMCRTCETGLPVPDFRWRENKDMVVTQEVGLFTHINVTWWQRTGS